MDNSEDAVKLLSLIVPELRTVLARQQRDYVINEEYPAEIPVESQVDNIDDILVHNLAMERQCGPVDY